MYSINQMIQFSIELVLALVLVWCLALVLSNEGMIMHQTTAYQAITGVQ